MQMRVGAAVVAGATLLLLVAAAARAERIAVLEFTNASTTPELDALGKGLQSMITTDLAQVQAFQLVERSRLADIQAELKLAKSDAVDKATAVKLGKLAGASHLLTGSYTVVGPKMRLDCRVFAVQTGDVLLAASEDGDKDAFFELEKTLVKKLVDSVGVKLAPKERAEMGRVHTADFEAFRKFSQGISLFDDKKYQDALDALRDASKRDQNFKLATLTLGEYERLIGQMRTQAEEIHTSEEEVERLRKNKELRAEADVIEKLFAIAARKGKSEGEQVARLTALHTLAFNYGLFGGNLGRLSRLRAAEDRFGMERTADALCASYWSEAPALFPSLPPVVSEDFATPAPESLASFDKDFQSLVATLTKKGSDYAPNRTKYLLDSIDRGREFVRRLDVDARAAVALEQKLYDLALRLKPETYWRRERQQALAKAYREVLDLDRSTAIFTALAAEDDPSTKKEYVLKRMAAELELNRDLAQLVGKKGALQPYVREWLQLNLGEHADRDWLLKRVATLFGGGDKLSPEAAYELTRQRTFPRAHHYRPNGLSVEGPVLIGAQPTWIVDGAQWFRTGARSDARRADELRWYLEKLPREPKEAHGIAIVDGQPRKEVSAKFTVSFAAPPDWYPPGAPSPRGTGGVVPASVDGRPDVSLLFGVRDVDAAKQEDAKTKKSELVRPLRAYALVFKPGAVQLVEVTELSRASFDRKGELGLKVLAEQKASLDGKTVAAQVDVSGTKVKVNAGGKSLAFDLPSPTSGFYGFLFQGVGYASIGALTVGARRPK